MTVSIRTQGVDLPDELRNHIERKLQFALDRHQDRAPSVEVLLSDVNGPRGGVDKTCQMSVTLLGMRRITIIEEAAGWHEAINRAARRLSFCVGDEIRRLRTPAPESARLSA